MNVLLMHRSRPFDPAQPAPAQAAALAADLALDRVIAAMGGGDEFLLDVAHAALVGAMQNDEDTIWYRQAVFDDCLHHRDTVRTLYDLSVEAFARKRESWWSVLGTHPSSILLGSVKLLEALRELLGQVRQVAVSEGASFVSEGFRRLFTMLAQELDDAFLHEVRRHLKALELRDGVLVSAGLGDENATDRLVLRLPEPAAVGWWDRLVGRGRHGYTFRIDGRDEAGARILGDMRNEALPAVANAIAQSADHVLGFFQALRTELAFYLGALNLHDRLTSLGAPLCAPAPAPPGELVRTFAGLYDVSLALELDRPPVGNSIDASGRRLIVVTGANQGGKSTFLRSVGLAQLMMQCGLVVGADAFSASVSPALFTHYRREEDETMTSGKFDEELGRMSEMADRLVPGALVLFNESFAATNEQEGSEIAWQVVSALRESRIDVIFVTHLYAFARRVLDQAWPDALFLRAERQADGTRTFRLIEAAPLQTSYGRDVYEAVFGPAEEAAPRA